MSQTRPIFVASGEGAGPAWMSIKADADGTRGALGMAEGIIPFGHSPSLHVHRDEDEAFYVLEGTVDFVCGYERFRAEAGAFVFLPRGLPHRQPRGGRRGRGRLGRRRRRAAPIRRPCASDVVTSTFGHVFAPDHAAAASELARVCRPGGEIGAVLLDAQGPQRADVQDHGRAHAAARQLSAAGVVGL